MKKLLFMIGIFISASHSVYAQKGIINPDFPVTFPKLSNVLKKNLLKESEIIEVIKTNGVDFQLTAENIQKLKETKVTPAILKAINENYVYPSAGIVNGKAVNLVKPAYPDDARSDGASGTVNVQVVIDENGNVTFASAVSGHPLLRKAAAQAAIASKFAPFVIKQQKVRVMGIVVYNFTN